jgi:endonuclease-3
MQDWSEASIREVVRRLEAFRESCQVTTLTEVEQEYRSPFFILVSCIISLRTKDEVTNPASRRLFALAETPQKLAELAEETIAETIFPAGFYRNKARQLKEIGQILSSRYQGQVPATEAQLLELPGVGRKTANLVLGLGFGAAAICVDTHVHRISNRLGWVGTSNPHETELELQKRLPVDLWTPINDLLVTFGQNLCHPTSPRCSKCPLADLCPRIGVTRHR